VTDQERLDRIDELKDAVVNLTAGLEEDGSEPIPTEPETDGSEPIPTEPETDAAD